MSSEPDKSEEKQPEKQPEKPPFKINPAMESRMYYDSYRKVTQVYCHELAEACKQAIKSMPKVHANVVHDRMKHYDDVQALSRSNTIQMVNLVKKYAAQTKLNSEYDVMPAIKSTEEILDYIEQKLKSLPAEKKGGNFQIVDAFS